MRLLTFCFRNLTRRKIRTTLCIFGVALATTCIVALGATTMRYTRVIKETNLLFDGQIMVVSKGAIVIQAIPIGGGMLPQNRTERLLQNITSVQKTVPILFVTPIGVGGIIQPVPVNFSMGILVEDWRLILGTTSLKGAVGHFPEHEDIAEAVVGASLADQYNWTVGAEIRVNGHEVRITGVLDTKMALLNRCIVMPLRLTQKIYNYPNSVNIVLANPIPGCTQEELSDCIEEEPELEYVDALTEDERNDMIQPVLAQVETWNLGIQTVILLLSLILVMTVNLMSVSERRRDFATLDAIGAPLSYVVRIVILEASLIGILGSVLGIIFGSLAALALASLYTNIPLAQFFPSISEIVPPLYMLEVSASIITVCCVGGIVPAMNAAKMRLSEVLKAEY